MAGDKNININIDDDNRKYKDEKDTLEFLEGDARQEDLAATRERLELELREEKADTQKRMAWMAMASMIIFTIVLFSPIISDNRVTALADLLGLFYIAQAGVVGSYMGVTAWINKK